MKRIILMSAIMLMAGTMFAADPNDMPNPTAQNKVTVCVQGNITYLRIYTPDINHRILTNDSAFPKLLESVIFRYLKAWSEKLFDTYNSDMNLLEAKAARQKRDTERIR